ncbi:MAG: ATP-binding cassette domain-containing protein [Desulfuromonadales bacterium]
MEQPMVEIDDLQLSLVGGGGRVNILRGIDLRLEAGDTLSIVGTSGAGKTTLLMAVSGLERASAGSIRVAGVDLGALDEDQLARFRRRHVGIVFQSELSGGEQQRVALARAFVARPSLLLADEPTGNLDRETGARVMELLFRLQAEQGTTFILVTHDASLAGRCRRRLRMADGRIFAEDGGSP